ncbi:Permease of the drug/metabolite transporter (DMT) superfamily [Pseudorhodobacter antarcticus]|uniref:Permease of the drug/metabolite transporter (DMT) superfamily n=1 Tax=Pseudorhodobacter antarcticus TaxID=1077947 RepID=A0A1H8DB49_9RHOB|nr:DMT family transporter [Pseudorhodobacter antarcticus]SEN04355.1 Permease of the drug/metabolite transporter (DMT) superfamily [Pseudorhodobacter antarcticus]
MNPDNTRASLLMLGSMAAFAFEDVFLKRAATALDTGQVIAMIGFAGALCFWAIAYQQNQPILTRRAFCRPALLRSVAEAVASIFYITALTLLPLSMNSAILQASPLVVTMGAALFMREPVGWRRWSAILVGFAGVLIVLRPGTDGFQIAGLLTVASVFALAARDLSTRMMPRDIGTFQLTTWAYLALVPAGLLLMVFSGTKPMAIDPAHWGDLLGALVTGLIGYWAVTQAMRAGDVSFVAPFRYSRLVFAALLAAIVFGERPDVWMVTGAALIIGSGLYSFARERRLRRKNLSKSAPAR